MEIGPLPRAPKRAWGAGEALSPQIPAPSAAIRLQAASLWLSLITSMGFFGTRCPGATQRGAGGDAIGDPHHRWTTRKPAPRPHPTHFTLIPPPSLPSPRHPLSLHPLASPISDQGDEARGRAPGLGPARAPRCGWCAWKMPLSWKPFSRRVIQ